MKKIRLLAILLAMLMIPFSMFFACDNTEDPVDDDPSDGDNGEDPDITPTAPIVLDDDGSNPEGGYLMYFHFNAAGNGRLNIVEPGTDATKPDSQYVLEAPYSTYLKGTNVTGGSYIVRSDGTRSYLSIERVGASTNPTLSIKAGEALSSDIDADHMLRFDLYFQNGYFGSSVDVYGGKNTSKSKLTFLTVENGAIKDTNGSVIYGDKANDKTGWIDVAIVISEQTRKYDIYIDGIKQTNGVDFLDSYPTWNEYKPDTYNFAIRNVGNANTYCYIDNLCMKNGNETTLGIYKGMDFPEHFSAQIPCYIDQVDVTKESILGYFEAGSVKNSLFSSSLFMANSLTLSKITSYGENEYEIEDLMNDYVAETGLCDEVSYLFKGNEYFSTWREPVTSGNDYVDYDVKYIGKIAYDSDKTDGTPAVEGTYTIADSGIITFNWGEAAAPKVGGVNAIYAKYNANNTSLTIYSNAECTTAVDGAVYELYTAEEGYADVEYATVNTADKITLQVSPFFMTAKLSVTPAEGDAVEGVYPYSVSDGVITVTVGGDTYTFTYNDEENVFVYGTDVALHKVVDEINLGENEKLAIKWTNFKSNPVAYRFINFNNFDREWWIENYSDYGTFVFEFYASDRMVQDGFQFKLIFNAPGDADKGNYFQTDFDCDSNYVANGTNKFKYVAGWNKFEINISTMGVRTAGALITDITGGYITMAGWSNGPTIDNDGDVDVNGDGQINQDEKSTEIPNDGYTLYIGKLAFTKNVEVELEGPAQDKADCKHEGTSKEDLFEKVSEPVAGNCVHGSYYIERCSNCGMTRVDDSRPIGAPVDHNLGEDVLYMAPTCTEKGYSYKECADCGYRSITDEDDKKPEHNWNRDVDWVNRKMYSICVVCGEEKNESIYEELIPMSDKVTEGKVSTYFYVDAITNNSISDLSDIKGSGSLAGTLTDKAGVEGPLRCAKISSAFVGGRNAVEVTHLGSQGGDISQHTYWSVPVTKKDSLDFVFEIDIMLGKKKPNGTYITTNLQAVERTNGSRDLTLFSVDNQGVGKLGTVSGTTETIQLSDTKFTNIVIVYSSTKNTIALYADGYFVTEAPFMSGNFANASEPQFQEFRWNMESTGDLTGGSTYFGGILYYEGSAPICVINEDIPKNAEETTGDIVLKDDIGNPMLGEFTVNKVDVNSYLGIDVFTTKYVLEFTLDGEDLADGTILKGTKRATGYDRYEDLITINDGKVYCVDRLISMTTENVKIALVIDDTIGCITVYVNGAKLDGTVSYSNDDYADENARIRSICFLNDCGVYTVSGLQMYTGTSVK